MTNLRKMYAGKRVAITGHTGFIGKPLTRALDKLDAVVIPLHGDVRDPVTFTPINHSYNYLFHFAAPSSQVLFKQQAGLAQDVTINGFLNAAKVCRENGVKLIYPSTGILSAPQSQWNEYARSKKILEDIHFGSRLDALALRIFATYGPNEAHKRDYASVPYLFARDIKDGRSPVVFGDGSQTRDIIYIDDTVRAILTLAELASEKVVDIGSGTSVSFNDIILTINDILGDRADVEYVDRPMGYVDNTYADIKTMLKYCDHDFTSMFAGLSSVLKAV